MTQYVKIFLCSYSEGTQKDEYGDLKVEETRREVYATCKSITQSEFYQAQTAGLKPSFKFILATSRDYQDEEYLVYNSVYYKILRTYTNERDEMELTVYGGVRDAHAENSNESS